MIRVKVRKRNGEMEIYVEGHAGDGKSEICTAVSAIMASTELFLKELAKQHPEAIKFESEGK